MIRLLTIPEVAQKLACCERTVRRAIDAGKLRVVRLGRSGKSDRVHPDDLDLYVASLRTMRPRGKECLSTGAVVTGTFRSRSAEAVLEHRLGSARPRRKPKSSKRGSGRTSMRLVSEGSPTE